MRGIGLIADTVGGDVGITPAHAGNRRGMEYATPYD